MCTVSLGALLNFSRLFIFRLRKATPFLCSMNASTMACILIITFLMYFLGSFSYYIGVTRWRKREKPGISLRSKTNCYYVFIIISQTVNYVFGVKEYNDEGREEKKIRKFSRKVSLRKRKYFENFFLLKGFADIENDFNLFEDF